MEKQNRCSNWLIDVECGMLEGLGEQCHGNRIMEFETGTTASNGGKFFVASWDVVGE